MYSIHGAPLGFISWQDAEPDLADQDNPGAMFLSSLNSRPALHPSYNLPSALMVSMAARPGFAPPPPGDLGQQRGCAASALGSRKRTPGCSTARSACSSPRGRRRRRPRRAGPGPQGPPQEAGSQSQPLHTHPPCPHINPPTGL